MDVKIHTFETTALEIDLGGDNGTVYLSELEEESEPIVVTRTATLAELQAADVELAEDEERVRKRFIGNLGSDHTNRLGMTILGGIEGAIVGGGAVALFSPNHDAPGSRIAAAALIGANLIGRGLNKLFMKSSRESLNEDAERVTKVVRQRSLVQQALQAYGSEDQPEVQKERVVNLVSPLRIER